MPVLRGREKRCRNYERVWRGEVDELHVLMNGTPLHDETVSSYERVGARVRVTGGRAGHGEALRQLLNNVGAGGVVMLCEDDAFVRQSGAVCSAATQADRDGVVLGSPRSGMDSELAEAALERWGPVIAEGIRRSPARA